MNLDETHIDEKGALSILQALVESDEVGPSIKSVLERSLHESFVHRLDAFVEKKQTEIQDLCNENYKEFIQSVEDLLTVRSDVLSLKKSIIQLDEDIQDSGFAVLKQHEALLGLQKVKNNIASSLEVLLQCQEAVTLTARASEHIQTRKYFPALKILDQLQRIYLPRISGFFLPQKLEQRTPSMISGIKQKVTAEFNDWLVRIRDVSLEIGQAALQHVQSKWQQEEDLKARQQQGDFMAQAAVTLSAPEEPADQELSLIIEQGKLDLSAVYQSLYIYDYLEAQEEFKRYYTTNRRLQATLDSALPSPSSGPVKTLFRTYFARIAGFFIVEHTVMKSTSTLLSSAELDSVWEVPLSRISSLITNDIRLYIRAPTGPLSSRKDWEQERDVMLQLKDAALLFCTALQSLGYSVGPVLDMLLSTRQHYMALLLQAGRSEFEKILVDDHYEPLIITAEEHYRAWVIANGLVPRGRSDSSTDDAAEDSSSTSIEKRRIIPILPATLPFSISVPLCCGVVKSLLSTYVAYVRHMNDSHDALRKALDSILTKGLSDALGSLVTSSEKAGSLDTPSASAASTKISKANEGAGGEQAGSSSSSSVSGMTTLSFSQAVQISVNCSYFVQACANLDEYAFSLSTSTRYDSSGSRLSVRNSFLEIRARAEGVLYETLYSKIDTFVGLAANINWTPTMANKEASEYMQDLVRYLEVNFAGTRYLAPEVREALYFASCTRVCSSLMDLISIGPVRRFNSNAVENLEMDIALLERFAASAAVPHLSDSFTQIRQLIKLFKNEYYVEAILDPNKRQMFFSQLPLPKLILVLERYRETGIKNITKKLSKVSIEAVVKRLKEMTQSEAQ